MRAEISRHLEKIYLPKISEAQLSRIIMYHAMNSSADSDYHIKSIQIKASKLSQRPTIIVIVNEEIRVDFSVNLAKKEVVHG